MPTGLGDELLLLCPSLDDSPNDLSGNGNNGTYVNGTSTIADSDPTYGGSRAYNFDGTDDYIAVPVSVVNGLLVGSISMWFKASSSGSTGQLSLFSASPGSQTNLVHHYIRNSGGNNQKSLKAERYLPDQSIGYIISYSNGPSFFADDNWHHYVCKSDSQGTTLYIDGVLVANSSTQGLFAGIEEDISQYTNLTGFFLGARNMNNTYNGDGLIGADLNFDGQQDDIRVYNRVLTQPEITLLASTRGFTVGGGTHVNRTLLGVG